jgi:hypothetical protein
MTICAVCEEEIKRGEPTTTTTLLPSEDLYNSGKKRKIHSSCYDVAIMQAAAVNAKRAQEQRERG